MEKRFSNQKAIVLAMVFLLSAALIAYFVYAYHDWKEGYSGKIAPGTYIGSIDISGLDQASAQALVNRKVNEVEDEGLYFRYADKEIALLSASQSGSPDSSFIIFSINADESLQQAITNSKIGFFQYLSRFWSGRLSQKHYLASYQIDQDRLRAALDNEFSSYKIAPTDASFSFAKDNSGNISFTVTPERIGKEFDYDYVLSQVRDRLGSIDQSTITLKTKTSYPSVYSDDLKSLQGEAENILGRGPLKVSFNDGEATSTYSISKEAIASWLISGSDRHITFDQAKVAAYLQDKVAKVADRDEAKPRFTIVNGKVSDWQKGSAGYKLDATSSAAIIISSYSTRTDNSSVLALPVNKVDSGIDNPGDIAIKEIIGTGHSNFKGSTVNRIQNIRVGASSVNGLLIAPNEEFSLVKNLGNVDAAAGYKPELVIKENKTMPEYGGGLCQVATTLFRAALSSGLPITMRQNHSYRVSYYEPAGTDAAVYIPSPDIRFVNDTGNYILIQYHISGKDLYFDFWGVKDGRQAVSTDPVIYNITKPQPTKLIETDTLQPGEKKCTEHAHNGADAYFDYTVTYPDDSIKTKRFKSHYVPWQEVCLIGKEKAAATSTAATVASSTEDKKE